MYRAFKKYGIHNFNIKLLGIFKNGILEQKEVEYIAKYKDDGIFLYNETSGGDGSLMVTDKEEKAIINLYVNMKLSTTAIASELWLSEKTVVKVLNNNYIFPENLSRFREHTGAFIEVNMIDIKTGEVLKTFPSIKYAGKFLGISDPSHISKVCRGKRNYAYGYKWEYV